MKPIEQIVKITWGEIKELKPCVQAKEHMEYAFSLNDDTLITEDIASYARKKNIGWADWALRKMIVSGKYDARQSFELASRIHSSGELSAAIIDGSAFSPDQRYSLAQAVVNEEPLACIIHKADLKPNHRFDLARNLTISQNIYDVGVLAPGLTGDQRYELAQKITDDSWICLAAIEFKGLKPAQRYSLIENIANPENLCMAATHVPGLSPDQRMTLRKRAMDAQEERGELYADE